MSFGQPLRLLMLVCDTTQGFMEMSLSSNPLTEAVFLISPNTVLEYFIEYVIIAMTADNLHQFS